MSKDKLQKDAVCTVLETIITAVNINLAEFDAPFYIKGYWDKMRICAHVNADALYDVRRLSGGQKTLLALAARVAIASYFASNIGLLVLDEPTAALDKGNQTCVETVVEIMRKHVDNSSDMQLIVVTHEHLLARACDSVLTLSPPFEEKHVN